MTDRLSPHLARARAVLSRAYLPLVALVVAGVAVRLYTMGVYSTVVTDYYTGDAGRYIRFGYSGLFEDEWQPAGYAAVLSGIRELTNTLTVTIAFQHLLGIVTALLLYATVRRAGGARVLALVPAALVLLSGDHLFLEHAFLTEAVWIALLAAGLYAAVRGGGARDLRWTAAAGGLLALSALVRNVSLILPAVLALWVVLVVAGPLRARLRAGAVALAPAVLVVVAYTIIATSVGSYSGMGEMSGWSLYQRTAQFADCDEFTPPDGTRGLCESRPTAERPGPFFYYWDATAPARRVFPAMSPDDGDKAGEFARAAIVHQPFAYLRTVGKDVVRYFDSRAGVDRQLSGSGPDDMAFRQTSPDAANTAAFADKVRDRYDGVDPTPNSGSSVLETYQRVFRVPGLGLLALLVLTAIGALRGVGYARAVCALCGTSAVVLLVLPPAVSSYDFRYVVPPIALLSASAALAVAALLARRATDPPPGGAAAEPAPGAAFRPAADQPRAEPVPGR